MRILYLSQYFPPEAGATQARAHDFAAGLIRAGHRVTMIAEIPNHPSGRVRPEYRGRLYERVTEDGLDVIRVWVKASPRKTFASRMALYVSYMCMSIASGLFTARERYNVIYAASPPLFVGAAGLVLSYLRRIPFVFEVRDLWPESAVALGELRSAGAARLARWLARRCYQRARRIIVVTKGMREHLRAQGVRAERLALIPNGANTELFYPQADPAASLRASLGLENMFVVLYGGIHGLAQDLGTILDAARRLRDVPGVVFLFVGEGPVKAELVARATALSLHNVLFHPEVPRRDMPSFLSLADVAVVPLRKLALFRSAVPSKLFDAWACGCPTVVAVEGEAQELLREAEAGVWVAPEDGAALVDAIVRLRADAPWRRRLGENGRRFVAARYSRDTQGQELERLLRGVCDEPVGGGRDG